MRTPQITLSLTLIGHNSVLEGRLRSFGGGFRMKANNVVVSGFTIKGSDFGVEVEDSANVILKDSTLTDCARTASTEFNLI